MSALRFVLATPAHANGIFEITTSVSFDRKSADRNRGWLIYPGTPEWWAETLASPTHSHVALDGETVVGFVYALTEPDSFLKIDRIAVASSHGRRGIAQQLLDAAIAASGATRMFALIMHKPEVNQSSLMFFRDRNGFRLVGEVSDPPYVLGRYERP